MIWARIETSSADTGSSQMTSLGLQDQRAGDADALALAAGEFVRVAVGLLGPQADRGQHVRDACLDLGLVGDAMQAQRIGQRAAHGLARIERGVGVLEDHLHGAGQVLRSPALAAGHDLAVEHDAAARRRHAGPVIDERERSTCRNPIRPPGRGIRRASRRA